MLSGRNEPGGPNAAHPHRRFNVVGGRPHIRGKRVRVADILGLFRSEGVPQEEILADLSLPWRR